MSRVISLGVVSGLAALLIAGCKDEPATSPTPAASASAPTPAAASTPAPAASASAAPLPPRSDCPKSSAGPGTFDKPCEGKGTARMMEAAWTGKTDDKGPQFRVTNKTATPILYGKVTAYFYDKTGKQLDIKDSSGGAQPSASCGGNVFGGVMKPSEKALLTFSCVKKETVPEGTAAIEAEVSAVGFADAAGKKSEYYWRNQELVPAARKKGGLK